MNIERLDWHQLSRRRFIKGSIAAGISLATLSGNVLGGSQGESIGDESSQSSRLLVFSAANAATLKAFAEAVLPDGPEFPSVLQTKTIQRLDEELYFVDAPIREDVLTALDALEWLPVISGYFSRFSNLSKAQRLELARSMMASRFETLRAIGNNLKIVIHFSFYAHPATWPLTGYDGPFARMEPKQSEQRMHYAERSAQV